MSMVMIKKVLLLFVVVCLVGCGSSVEPVDEAKEPEVVDSEAVEPDVTEEVDTEPTEVLYADNEAINKYLIAYNEANPEDKIDDFSVYNHHGGEHKNQIIFNKDGFEVVISGEAWSDTVNVVITGYKGNKNNTDSKDVFIKFYKGFSNEVDAKVIADRWDDLLVNDVHFDTFDECECDLRVSVEGEVEYFTMRGGV